MKLETNTVGYLNEVKHFTLRNDNGMIVKIINYGAIITSIEMPDKDGKVDNIVCGFDNWKTYRSRRYLWHYPYFGAIIGRSANRIHKGKIEIDGTKYQLATNHQGNHLHGGTTGFDKRLWQAELLEENDSVGVKMSYLSPDMEERYPGNLQVECIYRLNNENELSIEFIANTDKATVVNLTNHTYFNLTGGKENILNHELKINSTKITETKNYIPTGKIISVENSAFDFSEFKTIKKDIGTLSSGYDDNYVFGNNELLKHIATLREKTTGRQIDFHTTQPGMQLYTGYWIPKLWINGKMRFGKYAGIALETQNYPDAIHHDNFPSPILREGEIYQQITVFKFSVF